MNTEMDFIICKTLQNQEKKKTQISNKINKKIPVKIKEEKILNRLTCFKCGQDQLWCYCMYY